MAAAAEVCDEDLLSLLKTGKGRLRPSQKVGGPFDFTTSFPRAAYQRMLATSQQQRKDKEGRLTQENSNIVESKLMSTLGTSLTKSFDSAEHLAQAIVASLPEEETQYVLADVRVLHGGIVAICSLPYMEKQRVWGFLRCGECGEFCSGERGLRDHNHVKHSKSYEAAKANVASHASQLIIYTSDRSLIKSWEGEAEIERRARDSLGDPGLEMARAGDLEALRSLVIGGWDYHRAADKHGSNALMWAAGNGHLEVCKFLCENGLPAVLMAGPTHKRRRNALHWAARNGHLEVVKWLILEQGVPVDIGTSDGTTPFMYAVWQGHRHVVEWLAKPKCDGLTEKSEYGGGCAIGLQNHFGCNAIQWSVQTGDIDMCELLVQLGLDIKLSNRNGHSALHKASVKGQRRVCEWLLHNGGLGLEQMLPDKDGNTPADIARLEGYITLGTYLDNQKDILLRIQSEGDSAESNFHEQ